MEFFHTILYLLAFLSIGFLFAYIYIKIKFAFWSSQPVFHVYDVFYLFFPPGIIDFQLPKKNKYTNFISVKTEIYDDFSQIKKNRFLNFIKFHYLNNKENVFSPKIENIDAYFNGHNSKSFISFYNKKELLIHNTDDKIIDSEKIIGVITSRPLHILINNKKAQFDAYYVDYLCVDKGYRKKGIAQQIIQTHHYNQRYSNKNIVVSLFKREEELTGIVPLCAYNTYGFHTEKWKKNEPKKIHGQYKLVEMTKHNIHLLNDFIKANAVQFDIMIQTDIANIIDLIETKNIFVYVVVHDANIVCCYFYRKTCIFIKKNMEVLTCFASIHNINLEVFIGAFKISIFKILNEYNFNYCAIENISHNNHIIDSLLKNNKANIISPTAYFFYNFAYPTFQSNRVLFIG
jgi:ribosomal protein S18 acetylase RimI-like enzyme